MRGVDSPPLLRAFDLAQNRPCNGCRPARMIHACMQSQLKRSHMMKQTIVADSQCQCCGVKMQMARISKSTQDSPSSNAPIACPECHPEYAEDEHKAPSAAASSSRKPSVREAVWKYNMRAHWARWHSHTPIPAGLEAAITLSPGEVSLLRQGRGFAVKSRR